jgi:hypothetical protein
MARRPSQRNASSKAYQSRQSSKRLYPQTKGEKKIPLLKTILGVVATLVILIFSATLFTENKKTSRSPSRSFRRPSPKEYFCRKIEHALGQKSPNNPDSKDNPKADWKTAKALWPLVQRLQDEIAKENYKRAPKTIPGSALSDA